MTAYDELLGAAQNLETLVKRYRTAIETGDASTRTRVPTGDKTHATSRLVENVTLTAAYAYVNSMPNGPASRPAVSRDAHDESIDAEARRIAASTPFRAAIEAAVKMIIVRQ